MTVKPKDPVGDSNEDPLDPQVRATATQLARTVLGLAIAALLPAQMRISVLTETVAILLAFYTESSNDEELVEVVERELRRLLALQRPQVERLLKEYQLERCTPEEVVEARPQGRKETIH